MDNANICLNCGHTFSGKFCNACGEKVYTEHDKSVFHLFEEAFHFVTHFEGKFFNTLKAVLLKPGKLSVDYCNGIRKKYFKPISFFLMVVILYLLFPVFTGLNMRLQFHLKHEMYGTYATEKIEQYREKNHLTEEEVAEAYNHKSEKTSKILLFLVLPCMALVSWGIGFWKRKYYFDHFIFSIEAFSILILCAFLLFPLLLRLLMLTGLNLHVTDDFTGIVTTVIAAIYYAAMSRRFFHFKWWVNVIYVSLFIIGQVLIIQYIYRFLLFYVTYQLL
jgi:hypothetical protein